MIDQRLEDCEILLDVQEALLALFRANRERAIAVWLYRCAGTPFSRPTLVKIAAVLGVNRERARQFIGEGEVQIRYYLQHGHFRPARWII